MKKKLKLLSLVMLLTICIYYERTILKHKERILYFLNISEKNMKISENYYYKATHLDTSKSNYFDIMEDYDDSAKKYLIISRESNDSAKQILP